MKVRMQSHINFELSSQKLRLLSTHPPHILCSDRSACILNSYLEQRLSRMSFSACLVRVEGLGVRVQGLGFRVQGSWFRVRL